MVQGIYGHADLAETSYYIGVDQTEQRAGIDRFSRVFEVPGPETSVSRPALAGSTRIPHRAKRPLRGIRWQPPAHLRMPLRPTLPTFVSPLRANCIQRNPPVGTVPALDYVGAKLFPTDARGCVIDPASATLSPMRESGRTVGEPNRHRRRHCVRDLPGPSLGAGLSIGDVRGIRLSRLRIHGTLSIRSRSTRQGRARALAFAGLRGSRPGNRCFRAGGTSFY